MHTQKTKPPGLAGLSGGFSFERHAFPPFAQSLQSLVNRFGCGIADDLEYLTVSELAGLYSHLKTLEGRAA